MSTRLVPLKAALSPLIPVHRPVVLVGRHPECDIRIDLPKISRRHCCLALAYDRVVIRDLGSRNGLRVNGAVTEEAELRPGDMVAIGPLLFRVESTDAEVRPAVPAGSQNTKPPANPIPAHSEQPITSTDASPLDPLPILPIDPEDPDGDLIPLDIDF